MAKTTVQVEKLREREGLQSTIRSESLYSYDEARPGYVERPDDLYSNPWMQLSRSLAGFDQPLSELHRKQQEKEIERGLAEGDTLFTNSEADPTTGNRLAWKEFVEKNPNMAGLNPWVQKGYETARMRSLGLDFKAQLQEAYTKNGLMNETDQAKVSQFVDQFEREFRKKHGLDVYDDKVILAENYTKNTLEGRAAILNRHTNDFAAENLKRVTQEYTQLASKQFAAIVDNPDINLMDPDAREQVIIPQIQEAIQRITQEAASYGVLNSDVPGIIFKAISAEAVERGYEDGGRELLEIAKNLDFGVGKLGDIPEYKDWFTKTEKVMDDQEEQDRLKREREQEKAQADAAVTAAIDGVYFNAEQLRAKGIAPHKIPGILGSIESIKNKRLNDAYNINQWSPEKVLQYEMDKLKASRGQVTDADLREFAYRYGPNLSQITSLMRTSENAQDTMTARSVGSAQSQVFKLTTGKKVDDLDAMSGDQLGNPIIQRGLEAMKEVSFLLDEKIRKETGDGKGELTASRAEFLTMEAVEEVLKKEKYQIYAPDSEKPQHGAVNTNPTTTPQQIQQAQAQLMNDAGKKPLFGIASGDEWEQAVDEMLTSSDPTSSRLRQQMDALQLTTEQRAKILQAQHQFFNPTIAGPRVRSKEELSALDRKVMENLQWYFKDYWTTPFGQTEEKKPK
jgi:hypothetical protein